MTDIQTLAVEVSQPLAEAKQFRVSNSEQYQAAGERLKGIKLLLKKVGDTFDPIISKAHAAHREAVARKKEHEQPLMYAEALYKQAMLIYQAEQERVRRAEQTRLEEQARQEREKLEARAAKAAEKGKEEKAAELMAQAATVATPVLETRIPTVTGISTRSTWKAEVVSKSELIKAVAAGAVPQAALIPDTAFLNQQARSLKSELNYPGVKVVEVQGIASRSA